MTDSLFDADAIAPPVDNAQPGWREIQIHLPNRTALVDLEERLGITIGADLVIEYRTSNGGSAT